jgi:uncharacterized membrane protein YidH (DUF202 family)
VGAGQRVRSHDHLGQFVGPEPVGLTGPAGETFKIMAAGGALLIAATCLAAVLSLAFRYRRAPAAERAQLKWLVYACALIVVAALAGMLAERIAGPDSNAANNFQNAVLTGAAGLVRVSIGIAILRYRLYDIDRVISRTLAYAIVTGLLAGIYAGLVLLATQVLRFSSPVAIAAATLAAAALFSPMRRRVQRMVDRRFNRARYDAETTVAEFAAERCRRPGRGPGRPDQRRAADPRARPRIGVDQPPRLRLAAAAPPPPGPGGAAVAAPRSLVRVQARRPPLHTVAPDDQSGLRSRRTDVAGAEVQLGGTTRVLLGLPHHSA